MQGIEEVQRYKGRDRHSRSSSRKRLKRELEVQWKREVQYEEEKDGVLIILCDVCQ